jgi:hypothetical protein
MQCKELLIENGQLVEVEPRPAANTTAMVAWRLKLYTPEYPEGREVICIANDITIGRLQSVGFFVGRRRRRRRRCCCCCCCCLWLLLLLLLLLIVVVLPFSRADIGSFAIEEDDLYNRVSQLSRREGIPRIYISVNSGSRFDFAFSFVSFFLFFSFLDFFFKVEFALFFSLLFCLSDWLGARIGLADEVKFKWKIAWVNPENQNKGFKYIYLSEDDFVALNKDQEVVLGELVEENGERRYKITDVIGAKNGFGGMRRTSVLFNFAFAFVLCVWFFFFHSRLTFPFFFLLFSLLSSHSLVENLKASGMIAGETSRAYQETFTISLVTCRSVGIGAYLVRLGQRVVQVESSTILLTGAAALNKLLGKAMCCWLVVFIVLLLFNFFLLFFFERDGI